MSGNDVTIKGSVIASPQGVSQVGDVLPGSTITWTPQKKNEAFNAYWLKAGGSPQTADLARFVFLKLNRLDKREFDFKTDVTAGKTYIVPNPVDLEANYDDWSAFVGDIPESSPAYRAVYDDDTIDQASDKSYKTSSSAAGQEGLVRPSGTKSAGVTVGGVPTPVPVEASAGQGLTQGVSGEEALKQAEDVRKPGLLNKVFEVLELFLRFVSPVFNLLMLYVRVLRVAFTWVKNLVAKTSMGQSLGLKETKIDWGAEFKRGLADFAGILFPPLGALGHAGINYWFDNEPAEQFGGLNYYIPGQSDKSYAFKKELDWVFGKLKAGKDAVVDGASRTGHALKAGGSAFVDGFKADPDEAKAGAWGADKITTY